VEDRVGTVRRPGIRQRQQRIPQRFLPRDVEKDPVFAPIQARPEFKALFQTGQ
jgi:hypothetical protein